MDNVGSSTRVVTMIEMPLGQDEEEPDEHREVITENKYKNKIIIAIVLVIIVVMVVGLYMRYMDVDDEGVRLVNNTTTNEDDGLDITGKAMILIITGICFLSMCFACISPDPVDKELNNKRLASYYDAATRRASSVKTISYHPEPQS